MITSTNNGGWLFLASDFIPIFIPWFWQHEYRADPPEGFSVAADERDLIGQFNLNEAQLAWRRKRLLS